MALKSCTCHRMSENKIIFHHIAKSSSFCIFSIVYKERSAKLEVVALPFKSRSLLSPGSVVTVSQKPRVQMNTLVRIQSLIQKSVGSLPPPLTDTPPSRLFSTLVLPTPKYRQTLKYNM